MVKMIFLVVLLLFSLGFVSCASVSLTSPQNLTYSNSSSNNFTTNISGDNGAYNATLNIYNSSSGELFYNETTTEVSGNALYFDAADYVEISTLNNTLFNQTGTYSVSNWFKIDNNSYGNMIWNFADGGSNRIALILNAERRLAFNRYNGSYTSKRTTFSLNTSQWYHAVSVSNNGNLQLFLDYIILHF